MNQDEKHMGVIIGIASDTAKLVSIWEVLGKLFGDRADEVVKALAPVAEAFSGPLLFDVDEPYLSAKEIEEAILTQAEEDNSITVTSPKTYGMSIRKHPRKTAMHYNYIPQVTRNQPYQRRAY